MSQTDYRQFNNSGRRVVFNTTIMYVQFILNILVGFISVRLILKSLGHSDYGLYDLIAGIINLFGFITGSLSQSTMRFISVGLGKGVNKEAAETFNACFWLHLAISVAICVLLEVISLVFGGSLNIPEGRLSTSKIVFQCMVVSMFLNINISPLTALISSCENFIFISVLSIIDSLLKLLIAIALCYSRMDNLLLYGILMMCVSIFDFVIYFVYSHKKYKQLFYIGKPDISQIKSVTGFVGWTLLDTFSSAINRQGYAIMLNKFFGTIINSSFAIARQLEGQVYTISANVVNSMRPQILKSYGSGDTDRMFRLSLTAGKFGLFMMSLVCIPLIVMMPDVLTLWLGNYPQNSVSFARLLIVACMAEQVTRGLVYANQALGNIKWFSVVVSSLRILALPVSVIFLLRGAAAGTAITIFLVFETIGSISRVIILSRISSFCPSVFIRDVFLKSFLPLSIAFIVCVLVYPYRQGVLWMLFVVILSCLIITTLVYLVGLTKEEKLFLSGFIKGITIFKNNKKKGY